jgi:hypothetical protein
LLLKLLQLFTLAGAHTALQVLLQLLLLLQQTTDVLCLAVS